MNKNRIRGSLGRTSGRMTAKSISIKGPGCKFGGCARKAVELTPGGLRRVPVTGLGKPQGGPSAAQKSADGIVGGGNEPAKVGGLTPLKARTVPVKGLKAVASKPRVS